MESNFNNLPQWVKSEPHGEEPKKLIISNNSMCNLVLDYGQIINTEKFTEQNKLEAVFVLQPE